LELALRVERWGAEAVFGPGAVDLRTMALLDALLNVYRVVGRYRGAVGAEIHRLGRAERDLLFRLREMGLL
jgi:hypothetical protein